MKKMKALVILLAAALLLSVCAGCGGTADTGSPTPDASPAVTDTQTLPESQPPEQGQEPEADPAPAYVEVEADVPYVESTAKPGDADYALSLYEAELVNYKLIRSIPVAYEEGSWDAYIKVAGRMESMKADALTEDKVAIMEQAVELRKALIQIKPYADSAWYIWGDDMAVTGGEEPIYAYDSFDYEGFRPFLVPYLLEDQSEVKGIMIAIGGGGYYRRNNPTEGYPIAEKFNELGYNCFVLQRRVLPCAESDAWLDLQRAIRYIRYYADELGIAGTDCIMASGFSGGGCTISGQVCYAYGDMLPTVFDADYTPDAIDAVNSDLDIACLIYGPVADPENDTCWTTDNPNLPAVFIAAGYEDVLVSPQLNIELANWLQDRTTVELHLFAFSTHGFGVGTYATSSYFWPEMADAFAIRVTMQK